MISEAREQEIRKLIRAAQHNGNWEYVIDFEDVTDLLALLDEQKERIATLEGALRKLRIIATGEQDADDEEAFLVDTIDAALARVTQDKP